MRGLDLVEEVVTLPGRELRLLRPRDAEALIDEDAFAQNEFLPYWGELWASGVELARALAARELAGARVLELGCGLGIPSIAAALAGAEVLATDWAEEAVALLRRNARRNGARLAAAIVDWAQPDALVAQAPFDLVVAADVLYERRNVDQLLALLPRLGGEVLLADPDRPFTSGFLERAGAAGWRVDEVAQRIWSLHTRPARPIDNVCVDGV